MKKNKIIYIGNFDFPDGNASGKRVYGNGKALREVGYEVEFIGVSKEVKMGENLTNSLREYDGFSYFRLPQSKSSKDWLRFNSSFNSVKDKLNDEKKKIKAVIYYGSPRLSIFNHLLIKWCKKNNIKVISDCVDWLLVKTNNPLFDLIKWSDNFYQKAYLNKKTDGVIAISSYLSDFYQKAGLKTVIIPPLSTNEFIDIDLKNDRNCSKLLYAGLPFRKNILIKDPNTLKDRIDKTVILLSEAKRKGAKFHFNIFGFTEEEYLTVLPEQKRYLEILGKNVKFNGHVPNKEVIKELKDSDFTILIRDRKRDTMAGFPTKISESISYGTPVITTDTSDLKEYVLKNKTGFLINESGEELYTILSRNNKKLKNECKKFKGFHYSNYLEKMDSILK